ncbi:MAG: hypothetical protein ACYCQI_12335 [Gammaproteobacteria bacterium]
MFTQQITANEALQAELNKVLDQTAKIITQRVYKEDDIEIICNEAISIVEKAKKSDIHLDLTAKSQAFSIYNISILSIALAADKLEFIDELLQDQFHSSKYNYQSVNSRLSLPIKSYPAVQRLLKHGVLQQIKEKNPLLFKELLHNVYVSLANIREFDTLPPEFEYSELPLKTGYRQSVYTLPKTQDFASHNKYTLCFEIIYGLYNLGVEIINKDKKLLANYNLLPQTYSAHFVNRGDSRVTKPYNGQLKALYVMRIALDSLAIEDIWKYYAVICEQVNGCTQRSSIEFPDGAGFINVFAAADVFGLYITNNLLQFAEYRDKAHKISDMLTDDRLAEQKGIGFFTGEMPEFGFIDSKNIMTIINNIMAKEPKLDIFQLLQNASEEISYRKDQKTFLNTLIKDLTIAMTTLNKDKKAFFERKEPKNEKLENDFIEVVKILGKKMTNQEITETVLEKLTTFKTYFNQPEFSHIMKKLDVIIPKIDMTSSAPKPLT